MTHEELSWRWFEQQPIAGTSFMLNDPVRIVAGPHTGSFGSVIALLELEPEPRYQVELSTGLDIEAAQSRLRSAHLVDRAEILSELQHWYSRQTDGQWEHEFGIRLETLDNPGWSLSIDLTDTELATRPFKELRELEPVRDWIVCQVVDGRYEARGGPFMLERMLQVFTQWAYEQNVPG